MSLAITFSRDEIDLFSAASHDQNPLHCSELYARKTVYGEPVVFGALGTLAILGRLRDRPHQTLASLSVDFRDAISVDVEYRLDVQDAGESATVVLHDGRRTLIHLEASFAAGSAPSLAVVPLPAPRVDAADLTPAALVSGLTACGRYAPAKSALEALLRRYDLPRKGIGARDVAVLCLASFVAGMEIPGQRALFSRLLWKPESGDAAALDYQARVSAYDERFELVRLDLTVTSSGRSLGPLNLEAFVRTEIPAPAPPPRSEAWAGKVALVTGASRGLGAALSRALAWQGCTVLALFLKSRAEAEALSREPIPSRGRILAVQADASDLDACEGVRRQLVGEGRSLDLLVCSAFPPVRSLWIDAASARRIEDYVAQSIRLVCSPMSIFLPMLAASTGQMALVSSAWVSTLPAEWPHYVSAKLAAEGLVRIAAKEYPGVRFLLARPPRLLTDLTNTPTGRRATSPAHEAANAMVARLASPAAPGVVDLFEEA